MGGLKELPPELIAGWALWLLGGLVLMIWFRRRSASRPASSAPKQTPPVDPHPADGGLPQRQRGTEPMSEDGAERRTPIDPPDIRSTPE